MRRVSAVGRCDERAYRLLFRFEAFVEIGKNAVGDEIDEDAGNGEANQKIGDPGDGDVAALVVAVAVRIHGMDVVAHTLREAPAP